MADALESNLQWMNCESLKSTFLNSLVETAFVICEKYGIRFHNRLRVGAADGSSRILCYLVLNVRWLMRRFCNATRFCVPAAF